MMYDFSDVRFATKDEQIRAWSVEQAIEVLREQISSCGVLINDEKVVDLAVKIEDYVKNGKPEEAENE